MPHSSGGGSHGGGSHGGSHHSSGGHGSGGSSYRTSRSYFAGSSRYVYYRNKKPVYVYSSDGELNKKKFIERPFLLLFYLPFLWAIFFGMKFGINIPTRLPEYYDTEIVVEDTAHILGDTTAIEEAMAKFYDTTGITMAFLTVNNEDWEYWYDSLESYAYEAYVTRFSDESHWLIVYSQPTQPNEDWVDWYWEGMQGDDTENVITEELADEFVKYFQDNLYITNKYNVNSAFVLAVNNATENAMKISFNFENFATSLMMFGFICFHAYFMCGFNPKASSYKKAVKVELNAKEDTCSYCQGVYVVGSCTSCPHCGAPIRAHVEYDPETNRWV